MLRIQNGDEQIYQELLDQHISAVSQYATRLLGNTIDAEDIVQDTFVRVWTAARTWQPGKARVTTWIHRIAHNLCMDFFRKDKRALHDEVTHQLESDIDPMHDASNKDLRTQMQAALSSLPVRQRNAIVLCHYQGLSNRDAAEIVGVSVDALESLMARGRRTLRNLLADQKE